MRGLNRVIIAGNLTKDPDLRYTVSKRAFVRFGVAINSRWRNPNGELQDHTEFINVIVWGSMAENCGKYLKKGSPVLVEGRIQTTSYDARDGSGKRYSTEINAFNVMFLSSGSGSPSGFSSGQRQNEQPDMPPWPETGDMDPNFGSNISEEGFDQPDGPIPF